jgi:hypothetical protein
MEQSILIGTKKILGLDESYTAFDHDILTHINSAFSTLNQLGVGPAVQFIIEDDTATWADFINDDDAILNLVRSYVYLKVRLIFDPPATSYAIGALKEQIQEFEWRMNTSREDAHWVDPDPDEVLDEEEVLP